MNARTQQARMWLGAALVAAPIVLFAVLRVLPARFDPAIMASTFHFYVVGFTSLASALACALVIASARTIRNSRLLFLALGFFAIGGIFAVHGLATPGFLTDQYYASLGVSAWLSAAVGPVFIAASAIDLPKPAERIIERNGVLIFAIVAAGVATYILLSFTSSTEHWLDWVPIADQRLQWTLGFGGMALTAFAAWRYFQSYLFARLPSQLAMVATLVYLMEVQAIIIWGQVWHLSWWLYHGLYGVAFLVLFAGWAIEVRRAGTLRAITDALSMRDALAQLNRGLEAPIVELVDAVEAKDRETFGHVRRVSSLALAIGRRLGLPPSDLRSVVLAAEMHDVGKISVPDSVLAKPGPLTEEEFAVVKTHTVRGYEIALQVAALQPVASAIRHHHERLDGSGYPDALAGDEIPLISRIIAVADTYDAMTSKRPYRDPGSHLEAMAEILRLKGVQLDARCVDALVAVFAEPGARSLAA